MIRNALIYYVRRIGFILCADVILRKIIIVKKICVNTVQVIIDVIRYAVVIVAENYVTKIQSYVDATEIETV